MKGEWLIKFRGGILFCCLLLVMSLLLMGAVHPDRSILPVTVLDSVPDRPVPLAASGRYQLATWASGVGYGAFVLDTATGVTKVVYSSGKGPGGKTVNNIGKPFSKM